MIDTTDWNAKFDEIAIETFTQKALLLREVADFTGAKWFEDHLEKAYQIKLEGAPPKEEQVEFDWYADNNPSDTRGQELEVKSVLNVEVSLFKSHLHTEGRNVNLLDFLHCQQVKDVQAEYNNSITEVDKKAAKAKAMAITPGGTFSKRCADGLIQASGLIQFDIDAQDNEGFDPVTCRDVLGRQPWCAFSSLSISGEGVWGLALVGPGWKQSVGRLMNAIKKLGYRADKAPSNIASMRYLSYDQSACINPTPLHLPPVQKKKKTKVSVFSNSDTTERLKKLCEQCQMQGVSILESEHDWYTGGRALASLGEQGRDFFHSLSSVSHKYEPSDTDKKFDIALKNANGSIGLGTLFYMAKDAGINIKEL